METIAGVVVIYLITVWVSYKMQKKLLMLETGKYQPLEILFVLQFMPVLNVVGSFVLLMRNPEFAYGEKYLRKYYKMDRK